MGKAEKCPRCGFGVRQVSAVAEELGDVADWFAAKVKETEGRDVGALVREGGVGRLTGYAHLLVEHAKRSALELQGVCSSCARREAEAIFAVPKRPAGGEGSGHGE